MINLHRAFAVRFFVEILLANSKGCLKLKRISNTLALFLSNYKASYGLACCHDACKKNLGYHRYVHTEKY